MFIHMKFTFLFLCCFISASTCFCQTTEGLVYLYKKDGSPATDVKESSYFMHLIMQNDSTYICRYYNTNGPMIRQESFKDSNLTIPNGRFCWYNVNGALDSSGYVKNGKKDSWWQYKRNSTQTDMVNYDNGVVISRETYLYDENGKPINEDTTKRDTTMHVQVKAKFKKGENDWANYCRNNLNTPARLQSVLPPGQYTVIVSFLIDKQGKTSDIYLYQSCEWSGDAEIIRLIAGSPKWQPAIQDGLPVIYRQKQTLTFKVGSN